MPLKSTSSILPALANELLSTSGEDLTYALLEASVLHLHSYMLAEVAEVLLELLLWQRASNVDWLQPALRRLPARAAQATTQQCWQFHQYAMRYDLPHLGVNRPSTSRNRIVPTLGRIRVFLMKRGLSRDL